jgi:hypothetical protein
MEISARVDGSMGWSDEYAMGWCGLLAKGCTVRKARQNAYRRFWLHAAVRACTHKTYFFRLHAHPFAFVIANNHDNTVK